MHSSPLTPLVLSCRGVDFPVGPLLILIPPQAPAPPRPLASSRWVSPSEPGADRSGALQAALWLSARPGLLPSCRTEFFWARAVLTSVVRKEIAN